MHGLLRGFSKTLLKVWRRSLRHARILTVFFALAIGFFLYQIPKLTTELRLYDIVDPKFQSTERLREMKRAFGDENSVLLLFSGDNGGPLTSLQACRIRDWIDQAQNGSSAFAEETTSVLNPFRLKRPLLVAGKIEYSEVLPPEACGPGLFSAKIFRDSPWGEIVTEPSGTDLGVQWSFRDTPGKSRYGKFDPAPIGALWKNLETELLAKTPGLQAYLGGKSSFQWYYQQALKKDVWLNLALILVLLLYFRLFYGTWRSGLILISIILGASLFTFGVMSLVGSPLDYLSNGLFLMMCVAAVEDFIFISYAQLRGARSSWRPSIRSLLIAGFFTSLTTIVGFWSLETADLAIIRRFGFWAGFASACEWGMTFFVLPILLKSFRVRRGWVAPEKAHFAESIGRISRVAFPKKGLAVAFALFIGGLVGLGHLNFNDSPRENFGKNHPQRQAYDYLRRSRGWEGSIFVVFPNAFSREENEVALRRLASEPNVAHVESPYHFPDYFEGGFSEADRRGMQIRLAISKGYQSFFSRQDTARAAVYLKSMDLADLTGTLDRIREVCAKTGCSAAGEGAVYAEYSKEVIGTLFKSFLASLVLVGAIVTALAVAFRSEKKRGLLFSVFWSPAVVIGGLALFQIPMDFTNSIFASVLVGLTGDNAIQYLFASKRGKLADGIARQSGASVHVAIIAASASLLFFGLTLVPMKILGALLFFGFLIALAGDLWILNGITRSQT
jgi:predicted RND superfamily exporter protein